MRPHHGVDTRTYMLVLETSFMFHKAPLCTNPTRFPGFSASALAVGTPPKTPGPACLRRIEESRAQVLGLQLQLNSVCAWRGCETLFLYTIIKVDHPL